MSYFVDEKTAALLRDLADCLPRLKDAANRVLGLRGAGVANTAAGLSIRPSGPPAAASLMRPPAPLPQRLKIKTVADANGVAVCNTWDGTTAGTQDINVLVTGHFKVGEVLFAQVVSPTTGKALASDSTKKVDYLEYSTTYLIPVKLEKDGGDPGNKTNPCSFTYTAKSLSGITLLTAATPIRQRPPLGAMIVATAGECTFVPGTGAGTGLLIWGTDEWQAAGGC